MKDSDKLNYNEGLYMENVYLFQGLIITVFSFYYFRNNLQGKQGLGSVGLGS